MPDEEIYPRLLQVPSLKDSPDNQTRAGHGITAANTFGLLVRKFVSTLIFPLASSSRSNSLTSLREYNGQSHGQQYKIGIQRHHRPGLFLHDRLARRCVPLYLLHLNAFDVAASPANFAWTNSISFHTFFV